MNINKFLFEKIGEILKTDPIKVYIKYLDNALDLKLNFKSLCINLSSEENLAKELYGSATEDPKFFNYKVHSDLSRLNTHTMLENQCICVYQKKISDWTKVYDESIVYKVFSSSKNIELLRHIFVLEKQDDKLNISYCNNITSPHIYPAISEICFVEKIQVKSTYIAKIFNVLCSNLIKSKEVHDDTFMVTTNTQFLHEDLNFDEITSDFTILEHVDRPVIICAHTGSRINWKFKSKKLYNHFTYLGIFNESNGNEPLVICLTLDQNENMYIGYIPGQDITSNIIKQSTNAESRVPGITEFYKDVKNQTKSGKKEDKKILEVENWWKNYICRCDCCVLAREKYAMNIDLYGTQQKKKINLSILEYLLFFNLLTKDNVSRIGKVLNESIGALDIESCTHEIEKKNANLTNVTQFGEKNRVLAVQEMSLIGYGDHFSKGDNFHYKLFRIDQTNSAKNVVGQLVEHALDSNCLLEKEKVKLLSPITSFIEKFKNYHEEFWIPELRKKNLTETNVRKTVEESFSNGIIGKFQEHINRLKKALYIFTFNG